MLPQRVAASGICALISASALKNSLQIKNTPDLCSEIGRPASVLISPVCFLSSYLHSCSPPIIHGYLTCDTIFIQHNGLVKIGSGKDNDLRHSFYISIKLMSWPAIFIYFALIYCISTNMNFKYAPIYCLFVIVNADVRL